MYVYELATALAIWVQKKLVVGRSWLGRRNWLSEEVGCQESREQKVKRFPELYNGKKDIK